MMNKSISRFVTEITKQDILDALKKMDLALHPYLIYCHPSIKEQLKEWLGDDPLIESVPFIPEDKVLLIDRVKWEENMKEFYEGFIDYKNIGSEDRRE